jgi:hypothetical protein
MPDAVPPTSAALRSAAAALSDADVRAADLQHVLAAAVRAYHRKRAAGEDFGPVPEPVGVSATEVVVVAANMLQAADLDVFELGMWMRQGSA